LPRRGAAVGRCERRERVDGSIGEAGNGDDDVGEEVRENVVVDDDVNDDDDDDDDDGGVG